VARADDDGSGPTDAALRIPPTAPPAAVRAAIKAVVLAQTLGRSVSPTLGGRYRLVREIGRGGMGIVWEAELEPIGHRVAIKLLRSERSRPGEGASRLLREALSVSKIGHENIVRVDDIGTDDQGSPYLVMELLRGRSLAHVLADRGPLPWPVVAEIAGQVCAALAAAHALAVVHRDIKPANVFVLDDSAGGWRCKLLDFGLCKTALGSEATLTEAGTMLGTPGYMAPEQIRGDLVDPRSDLYSLGCLMFEMLTGRSPFASTRPAEILTDQLAGRSASLGTIAPALPRDAVDVVERAMATDPAERFQDANAMAMAIAVAVATKIGSRTTVHGELPIARIRVPEPSGASCFRVGRAILLGVVATVVIGFGIMWIRTPRASLSAPTGELTPSRGGGEESDEDRDPGPEGAPPSDPGDPPSTVSSEPLPALVPSVEPRTEPNPTSPGRAQRARRKPRPAPAPMEPDRPVESEVPGTRAPEIRNPFAAAAEP
jgi:serine/threonine protein kinase